MASTARTTGADAQAEELRRRNVAAQSSVPTYKEVPIKEKSKEKVRFPSRIPWKLSASFLSLHARVAQADQISANQHHLYPR